VRRSSDFTVLTKCCFNVVYDKTKDILYVGSNDKGIYEVRLDNMIDYSLFQGNAVIGFENLESKN
jgi:hypothetical protein